MIPPSKPNVTRLSDESVMVRWSASSDDGLPIQFFKVQYRMLGNASGTAQRGQWMTSSEDIPPPVRSYEVSSNFIVFGNFLFIYFYFLPFIIG